MKPEASALTDIPAAGCESENAQTQPAPGKSEAERGKENSTPCLESAPKPRVSFYESLFYWVISRH